MQDITTSSVIHQRLADRGVAPKQHWVDTGDVDATLLVSVQRDHNITLIGPTRTNNTWTRRVEGAFNLRAFDIRWDERRVLCPQGNSTEKWVPTKRKNNGQAIIIATFPKATCAACPVRSNCTISEHRPKSLTFRPRAEQEALHAARDFMASGEGRALYQLRAGIEGTLSQGVRAFGLRQCRYRSLAKTRVQHVMTALAVNAVRLVAWFEGARPVGTKASRFAKLRAA